MAGRENTAAEVADKGGEVVRSVFASLDPRLDAQLFVVRVDRRQQVAELNHGRAKKTLPLDEVSRLLDRAPRWSSKLRCRVDDLVGFQPEDPFLGRHAYLGVPVEALGVILLAIIAVDADAEDRHYTLRETSTERDDEGEEWAIARTVIEGTAWELLEDLGTSLDASMSWHARRQRTTNEILRAGADRFLRTMCAQANYTGTGTLLEDLSAVAALTYEGESANGGTVVIAHENLEEDEVRRLVSFEPAIPMDRHKVLRKLLQATVSRPIALLVDGHDAYGFGLLHELSPARSEAVFVVSFAHGNVWTLRHASHEMLRVENGAPRLPLDPLGTLIGPRIQRTFPDAPDLAERMTTLVEEVARSGRGALLVVSAYAKREADALGSQAIRVSTSPLTSDVLRGVAAVDGAVLLDQELVCHAFGVILDGAARPGLGDQARGSRYNSSVRYVARHEKGVVAVVISEDGGVTVIDHEDIRNMLAPAGPPARNR
ncbi:MAG: diadenylate cyclase [Planctomycetota bacterium]|nr:diadenylate cyclase [Planctomycetota bacterium]